MGASRKLQGEIDRVLKKVQEGVDLFDSIWNKVYDTDNANQKEKFEADLKKEIKKLQRYRDQIKTWIQSSEIKDKKINASYEQALMDARKLIEREMERFKICEKETKTKAFSKEGLVQQPKTDPREKAKAETRDWLNNSVSELESQIDNFEAEMEGLSVKKGKTRPPRLVHLETSITRHKAHIMKLELILRLLDNDELNPEEVNDVKEMLEDYVERNQDDFEDFSDVDDIYSALPLDKVESLEDLVVAIAPPAVVKGVSGTSAVLSPKTSLAPSPTFLPAVTTSATVQLSNPVQEPTGEDIASLEINLDAVPRTPPPKTSVFSLGTTSTTPVVSHAAPVPVNAISVLSPAAILPVSSPLRGVVENSGAASIMSPSSVSQNQSQSLSTIAAKEEEIASFPGRRPSPAPPTDAGLSLRGIGRGNIPPSSIPSNGGLLPSAADILAKRNISGGVEEKLGSSQPLLSSSSSGSSRMILPLAAAKSNDGTDTGNVSEAALMAVRVGSPSAHAMQWRPGTSFSTQNEGGQIRGRPEIAPDQREKYLERFQEFQQQGHDSFLGMPGFGGGNHKQFSAQQQNPLLHQFNSQSSSVSPQVGLGSGVQTPGLSTVSSASLLQQRNAIHQQSNLQPLISTEPKESDVGLGKVEDQQQHPSDDHQTAESAAPSPGGLGKNLMNEDDFKSAYAIDTSTVSGSLGSEPPAQVAGRGGDMDLSGQPLQSRQPSSSSLGVIGQRSSVPSDHLGAIGDNFTSGSSNYGGGKQQHDHLYNLQMLEAAFHKLPQPKDSERASYTPKHPAVTLASYPQVQAPIVNNPAFWERPGLDPVNIDTLFFAFYYQQNTYQQYLAAKELKKLSWRYHRKFSTWFQRHEEPKVATDEYEQGTYVYFDIRMADDLHGWCQRLKNDFTFEYNYLEDELIP